MLQHIPGDVTNIILDYYAQLRDLKWIPFIDLKTGKLLWKVNKYSTKYEYMNKCLKYEKENRKTYLDLDIIVERSNMMLYTYYTIGHVIPLKTDYYVDKWNMIKRKTYLYFEFKDEDNYTHYVFCGVNGHSALIRNDYQVYLDNAIFGNIGRIYIFGENTFALYLDKY